MKACKNLYAQIAAFDDLYWAYRAARAGLGHSVLIAGEAGVGKSHLLAEMSPDVAKLSAIGAKFGIDLLGSLPLAGFHS